MFDSDSRYADLETAVLVTSDGREVSYTRRRLLPQGAKLPLLVEVTLREGDRLDLVTARTLGEATQRWRVADANKALDPAELEGPGRTLRVPLPSIPGEERQ
ncbi:MAG TPA: hypothetical protein VF173_13225 [Thermoanaerobaculia bacterium]|nr:hypothetical protein [Thermoanaerobaculia bacterium]